jgi:hypothetical protein
MTDLESLKETCSKVPLRLREGIVRYVEDHIPPGDFMRRVLENDLIGAVGRWDVESKAALTHIVLMVLAVVPVRARGSREAVDAWLAEPMTVEEMMDDPRR